MQRGLSALTIVVTMLLLAGCPKSQQDKQGPNPGGGQKGVTGIVVRHDLNCYVNCHIVVETSDHTLYNITVDSDVNDRCRPGLRYPDCK